mmetsp:Transcript_44201/g.125051  ORF Transcript_44201/g.125051 Transcript_44201/m.125051 type:complete len:80 (-) Transcript_44201:646-885(-)
MHVLHVFVYRLTSLHACRQATGTGMGLKISTQSDEFRTHYESIHPSMGYHASLLTTIHPHTLTSMRHLLGLPGTMDESP